MLKSLYLKLVRECVSSRESTKGVAFLKASKELYNLSSLSYLALNIPKLSKEGVRTHCFYSDSFMKQSESADSLDCSALESLGLTDGDVTDWSQAPALETELHIAAAAENMSAQQFQVISLPIGSQAGETALFAVSHHCEAEEWQALKGSFANDIRILANYFHSHILRLEGYDTTQEILVSARELDCLKWTARGKTAWEASRILGISERTVRFHLNSARDKLQCANTTQAVATAISRKLIAM